MSIFLTIFVIHVITEPASATWSNAALLFAREMIGGTVLGLAGGWLLAFLLRRLALEAATAMVLALAFGLTLFGLAQVRRHQRLPGDLHRRRDHRRHEASRTSARSRYFIGGLCLAGADRAVPHARPAGHAARPGAVHPGRPVVIAIVLIVVARPVAVFACLLPFRFALA